MPQKSAYSEPQLPSVALRIIKKVHSLPRRVRQQVLAPMEVNVDPVHLQQPLDFAGDDGRQRRLGRVAADVLAAFQGVQAFDGGAGGEEVVVLPGVPGVFVVLSVLVKGCV